MAEVVGVAVVDGLVTVVKLLSEYDTGPTVAPVDAAELLGGKVYVEASELAQVIGV